MTIENYSNRFCLKETDTEKDRRRLELLNDPNYGIVLCFLDKFRSILNLPNYPLQLFEDHLVNFQEQIPLRLIDFHFALLKRLSLAKNAQRNKFDSIITKFVSRFDINDSEHLQTIGYLQSDIHIKLRIIKNLFESQFDLNQTFRNTLIDKSSREIKSLPLGRDRFGISYWLFMDSHCFVRLFREDVDIDRTWTIVAKNRDELEKFIKLLIIDFVVRKKFSDWIIDYEPFSSLLPSNEFEQCYSPIPMNVKEKEIEITSTNDENSEVPIKRKRGRPKSLTKLLQKEIEIISNNNEKLDVLTKRKLGRPSNKIDLPIKQEEKEIESMSNDDEKPDSPIKRKRGRPRGSGKLSIKEEEEQTITLNGRKNNSATKDNNNDKILKIDEDQSQQDETSMDDISLAIRRSSRFRKASTMESCSKTISQLSDTKTKRSTNNKTKVSNNFSRHRRRRKTTSSSDEHMDSLSEDEYYSDDYLSNQSQPDIDDNFFELDDEDNSTNNEQIRTAKTAQTSTIITACYVCLKSDRPEVLLLCDACDDAYHLECLCPILLSVPDGDWFCPLCEHKKLSNCLIDKLKELLINYNQIQMKQILKKSLERKIKIKEYSSDESITASESEHENDEESMLSINQTNENSNLSLSSSIDENKNNISQRGRHRRTRFDMKKILHNHDEFNHNYDSNDDGDDDQQITNFNLQLPTKITRLLHRRDRSAIKSEQQIKTFSTRFYHTSVDSNDTNELNEKLGSPLVYVNSNGNSRQIKSVVTNSKQTLKIVRRWNDVQRRSRIKAANMKILNETITSDCTDDNSNYCLDDTLLLPHSNDINSNNETKDENNTNIRSKINIVQPTNLISIDKYSSRNSVKKVDTNFDRLTRDIQFAVSESYLLPRTTTTTTMTKAIDQQHVKRISKRLLSPYISKPSLPSFLSKPSSDVYNIFKPKDSSISSTTDHSNIILTPSSSSLLDENDDQTVQMTND